jgi:ATP-dependent Clp protease ATP-binding subunit ClpC
MLERFTARARRVVVLAIEEARRRRHNTVGPEHLLMGILRDGGDLDMKVLERLRVSPETLSAQAERVLSDMPESTTGAEPTFAAELKAVLRAALTVERQHRGPIGPEHLLLGLLADDRSAAGAILRAAGPGLEIGCRTGWLYRKGACAPLLKPSVRFIATSKWLVQATPSR